MNIKNNIYLSLIIVLSVGCFDVEDKMTINKDGSGTIKLKYSIAAQLANSETEGIPPAMFNKDSLKMDFESAEGIKVKKVESYVENGKKYMEIIVEFDSFDNFAQSNMSGGGFVGQMSLSNDGKGNILFKREVCTDICDDQKEEVPNAEAMAEMLGAFTWSYEVKFPSRIIKANTNIDEKNNSAKWTFSMGSIALKNQLMTATYVDPNKKGRNKQRIERKSKQPVEYEKLVQKKGVMYDEQGNEPFTGEATTKRRTTNVTITFTFANGILNGLASGKYENGKKAMQGKFKNGDPDGMMTEWYENGNKKRQEYFKNNEKHGLFIKWYESGKKKKQESFRNNEKHGLFMEWYESGKKKNSVRYKDGELQGVMTVWYENGKKKKEYSLDGDGKEREKAWDQDGNIIFDNTLKN